MQDESGYEIAPFLCTVLEARAKLGARTGTSPGVQIQPLIPKKMPLEMCSALKTKGQAAVSV